MLVSAPSDVPAADLQIVADTISRWNFRSGREMSSPVTVVPILWNHHSYSVFGVRPQEALNEQLVDVADFGFAMFANRLGTETGAAPSGTVEEIDRLLTAGKHVSIVRNTAVQIPPGRAATEERLQLEEYLEGLIAQRRGLLFSYTTTEGLAAQLENVVAARAKDAAAQLPTAGVDEAELDRLIDDGHRLSRGRDLSIGVWPTTDYEDKQRLDSKGRPKINRHWYLVLTNKTGQPVKNVRFRYHTEGYDGPSSFDVREQDHEAIPRLAPDQSARFPIMGVMGSIDQVECIVTWQYDDSFAEEPLSDAQDHETRATVRAV